PRARAAAPADRDAPAEMNEGGHFALSVRADERDALVTVVDDGGGISNALLQRALELALGRRPAERAYTVRIPLDGAQRAASAPSRSPARRATRRAGARAKQVSTTTW